MHSFNASSGRVAEWLCSGLQIRVRRFNSDLGLQYDPIEDREKKSPAYAGLFRAGKLGPAHAWVAKPVYAADLKSAAGNGV